MKSNQILSCCLAAALFSAATAAAGAGALKSMEFKGLDGPLRVQKGEVVFSHYDPAGDAHNAVLLNPADGSFRNAVEGVPGVRFIAEDGNYLVYTARGPRAGSLEVRDRRSGARVGSVESRHNIQWGRIDGDRLIVLQASGPYTATATAQVYALPGLKPQRSTEITGGNDTALWGDKIVSVGNNLGIYDADLGRIAVVELPGPDGRACNGGPLRISADKAVIGSDCRQLVVVDLPSARVERVIAMDASAQSFDIADGVIFAVHSDDTAREVRALELSTGVELARLSIDTEFVAVHGNRLLGMKKTGRFPVSAKFTLYEIDPADIKSETSRIARLNDGCAAVERALGRGGDLHAALEVCERSGIKGFIDSARPAPEASGALASYAVALTRTLSRYNEGIALLERLHSARPDKRFAAELAAGREKARRLDPPSRDAMPAGAEEPAGVQRVPVDFGGLNNPIAFEGDRVYIARWLCKGTPAGHRGVVLDVLDRATFRLVKRVEVAECDRQQQNAISAIIPLPGYVVLGLMYRMPKPGRPNVAVVDAASLEMTASRFISQEVRGLKLWQGRLLACITGQRLDPESLSLVTAVDAETRACAKKQAVGLGTRSNQSWTDSGDLPVAETARFQVYWRPGTLEPAYRIASVADPAETVAELEPRHYMDVLPVVKRDAVVTSFLNGPYARRFMLFDIARREETLLFELSPAARPVTATVWRDFLLVALGRDLLIYDLKKRMTVKYQKDLMREIPAGGRGGVKRLLVEGDWLFASGLDDATGRVIELDAYLAGLPSKDVFAPQSR